MLKNSGRRNTTLNWPIFLSKDPCPPQLLGHSSIEMTRHYIQMLDEDLIEAHKEFGPIDKFLR